MGSTVKNSYYGYREGRIHYFCPLCKEHQSTKIPKKISFRHHVGLSVFTIAVTALAWSVFQAKGLFLYLFFWAVLEFSIRIRKRDALVCRSCGFDPFLYKVDVKRAKNALRKHWQNRIEKENLFAGIKLKNYQTSQKPTEETAVQDEPVPALDSTEQRP